MKHPLFSILLTVFFQLCLPANASTPYTAISLEGFTDVIKHWKDQNSDQTTRAYQPEQIVHIADNILRYQRANGGWPTNKDPLRILTNSEITELKKQRTSNDSSLDNRNTYPQIRYLAAAYQQTHNPKYRDAAINGLNYILDNQYSNGGWSHSPPRTDEYYGHITFADEVMPAVLTLLRDISYDHKDFSFISPALRNKCKKALALGDALLLKLQVRVNGKPTVWAGQYDRTTLKPTTGRSYELPALVSWESVAVVDYLMSIEQPSAEVVFAIENAVDWFERSKIYGIKIEKTKTSLHKFKYHTSTSDVRVVTDKTAPAIWARFYQLDTNEPLFANRDGRQVKTLAEVKKERRTGYNWYGDWPTALLEERYPAWREEHKVSSASAATVEYIK